MFKGRGFTDKLYFLNLIITWIYTFICLILTVLGSRIGIEDYSFIQIVCPIIWGELGVHTGFMVWKAKVENISKHTNMKEVSWNGSINID